MTDAVAKSGTPRAAKGGATLRISTKTPRKKRGKTVQFGSVSMTLDPKDAAELARNVGLGRDAMGKIKSRLLKPGVKLRATNAPRFSADPSNPKRLIRELHGKRESGAFEGGVFRVLP